MTHKQLEKELVKHAKDLPEKEMKEVIDYIKSIRKKRKNITVDNITAELYALGAAQTAHVEEELKDYRKLYPRE